MSEPTATMAGSGDVPFANAATKAALADVDIFFTQFSGYLVFFMQAGFAMLCAGGALGD